MITNTLEAQYWSKRYKENNTGWDIGHISTPLKEYIDQIDDKSIKILIPGAGNSYEAEYLWQHKFRNVHVIDLAAEPLSNLSSRVPDFPREQLHQGDFFAHKGQYDLILEQTFFCALPRELRAQYVAKMAELLSPEGKLVGLLFGKEFDREGPPHGGTIEAYAPLFAEHLSIIKMEDCYNSIKPRQGAELFFIAGRK